MEIQDQTDSEIQAIAEKMWDEIVDASNAQDWEKFSSFLVTGDTPKDVLKSSVLKQWEEVPVLTTLAKKREFLGILRRGKTVLVTWKQWSTEVDGEFLALLYLTTINSEVRSVGVFIK